MLLRAIHVRSRPQRPNEGRRLHPIECSGWQSLRTTKRPGGSLTASFFIGTASRTGEFRSTALPYAPYYYGPLGPPPFGSMLESSSTHVLSSVSQPNVWIRSVRASNPSRSSNATKPRLEK